MSLNAQKTREFSPNVLRLSLIHISARFADANQTAAAVDKALDGSGNIRILPDLAAGVGGVAVTDVDTVSYTHLDVYKRQIISFIIRPRWMPHGNSKTSFFPVWRCKDSVIWFAWNTGCPLLHRSRIGSARKELFIPSYCVLHEPLHPFPKIPDNSQPIKPI